MPWPGEGEVEAVSVEAAVGLLEVVDIRKHRQRSVEVLR